MGRLSGQLADDFEILVNAQHREPNKLCGRRDEQIRYRRRSVLTNIGKEHLDFQSTVFDGGREVLDRHGSQGGLAEITARTQAAARRIADFQPSDVSDVYEPALDAAVPLRDVRALGNSDQRRLIDQPRLVTDFQA